ncbi:MAG: hypothetical protein UV53_C0009G0024 [Candidatus Azambacteria bacterium GW2011_GWE1_42_9]|nr:MAG: hypothetical protein UU33_C0001G0447 [Candidatus Azambacteria bacterium GW2011_GWF1_41_10]KKS49481.1 MAG: hypothetical protein UV14_C0001G0227 [Candidatus Azambacteria bacterium GW2011_GWF2_42_22]KKS69195.1 MAG: hypothetical protein UV39_C0018G0008 [Candidatus Azambacteria bacterium GW2011_GWA2_42_62]KKS73805.1 MAG: hypothetical protein UV45_C0023G0005 [Candidatus Azambacteria bacterium GW2011_GWB1_42_72]KKS79335.1 MAG: hypothetical protein UV53_C0009G0024 [Candidatus Azambacteria bacte
MKTILALLFFFAIMIIGAQSALAQIIDIPNPLGPEGLTIPGLVAKIATWLLEIGSVIAVIVILWAALVFMTSGGNKERVTQARQTLWYAIIGLIVLLLASGVAELIKNFLTGNYN